MELSNSAFRLATLLEKVTNAPTDVRVGYQVWQHAFGLDVSNGGPGFDYEVVRLIGLAYDEYLRLLSYLESTGKRVEKYRPTLDPVRNAFDLRHLMETRDETTKWFVRTPLTTLHVLGEFVPELPSEDPLTEDQINEFYTLLNRVKESVKSAELAPELRSFLRKQVDSAEMAMREYPIVGLSAFEVATARAFSSAVMSADIVRAHADEEAISTWKELVMYMKKWGTYTAGAVAFVDGGLNVIKFIAGG